MILKKGDTGYMVSVLQQKLNEQSYITIKDDGDFGIITEQSVKRYQATNKLYVDGIVGRETWRLLGELDSDRYQINALHNDDKDNWLRNMGDERLTRKLTTKRFYLDSDEYIRNKGFLKPKSVFLHHTAGWHNPINTVNDWNTDKRGRVGTQFVIGGKSIQGNDEQDGILVKCFANNYAAYHLGAKYSNLDLFSIGIEICNFGKLIQHPETGDFYAWPALDWKGNWKDNIQLYKVPENQVIDLGFDFRGGRFYHKYTDAQITTLKELLKYLNKEVPTLYLQDGLIPLLRVGVSASAAFDYNPGAANGEIHGLWSHSNVRKDKSDVSPQPKLIQMLKSLKF